MPGSRPAAILSDMRRSYAVWWNEEDGPRHAGKLELGRLHALLSGNGRGRLALALDEITSIEYARDEVILHCRARPALRIGSLDAPGALREFVTGLARVVAVG
jgi:hypothetical protein